MPIEFFAWNSLRLIIALFIVLEVGTKLCPFDSRMSLILLARMLRICPDGILRVLKYLYCQK